MCPERLADNRAVSLCLRLLVDTHGQIVSGEVGELSADEHGQNWVRFRGSAGLVDAIHTRLAEIPNTHKPNG